MRGATYDQMLEAYNSWVSTRDVAEIFENVFAIKKGFTLGQRVVAWNEYVRVRDLYEGSGS